MFRNAILEAAEEVFSERGFHAARIHDVAEHARIAVGTIYNHFGQKEDVLRELIEERTGEMLAAISPAEGDPVRFEEMLAARLGRFLDYVATHRAFFRLAIEHGILGGATAATRQILGKKRMTHLEEFRGILQKLVADGLRERALQERDPDILVRFLGTTIRAFTFEILDRGGRHEDADAAALVDLFMHGAGARGSARPHARR